MRRAAASLAAALLLVAIGAARAGDEPPPAGPSAKDLVAKLGGAEAAATADALVAQGAAAVPDLLPALDDPALRMPALGVIERMGPVAKFAVPRVSQILKGASSNERAAAARAAGAIGADAVSALPALTVIVSQAKATDRRPATDAVRTILLDVARRAPRPKALNPADQAVARACDWLVRHQADDGHWGAATFTGRCQRGVCPAKGDPRYDVGVTGLATMVLLGSGRAESPATAAAAKRGLDRILALQRADGYLGDPRSQKGPYVHACAGRALAAGWERTRRAELRKPLERAVAFTAGVQDPKRGGWGYDLAPGGDCDTSVTAWMAHLVHAAASVGVDVEPKVLLGARRWVESLTLQESARTGYNMAGGVSARTDAMQDRYPGNHTEATTACGLSIRLMEGSRHPDIARGAELLLAKPPAWNPAGDTTDLYYWMHGSDAMRRLGGAPYAAWRASLLGALVRTQLPESAGCAAGSWPPVDPWIIEGGLVYSVCMAALALESCAEDPATRPALTPAQTQALAAMEAARAGADAELQHAIDVATQSVRAAFK